MKALGRVDLALLVLGGVDERLVALALLLLEVVVVARVEVDDAPIEVGDVGDHAVEEVAVVADDQERRPVQSAGSSSSQMRLSRSRWLVGSSMSSRSGCSSSSRASATRMRQPPDSSAMGRSKSVFVEAHAAQDGLRPRLELVAVHALEGGLKGAHLVQQVLGSARPRSPSPPRSPAACAV